MNMDRTIRNLLDDIRDKFTDKELDPEVASKLKALLDEDDKNHKKFQNLAINWARTLDIQPKMKISARVYPQQSTYSEYRLSPIRRLKMYLSEKDADIDKKINVVFMLLCWKLYNKSTENINVPLNTQLALRDVAAVLVKFSEMCCDYPD